jgi:hypothetical protein
VNAVEVADGDGVAAKSGHENLLRGAEGHLTGSRMGPTTREKKINNKTHTHTHQDIK